MNRDSKEGISLTETARRVVVLTETAHSLNRDSKGQRHQGR